MQQTEAGPLILAANLDVDLPDAQRGTVFAPTDAAFAAAAEKFGGELPQDALADVCSRSAFHRTISQSAAGQQRCRRCRIVHCNNQGFHHVKNC